MHVSFCFGKPGPGGTPLARGVRAVGVGSSFQSSGEREGVGPGRRGWAAGDLLGKWSRRGKSPRRDGIPVFQPQRTFCPLKSGEQACAFGVDSYA